MTLAEKVMTDVLREVMGATPNDYQPEVMVREDRFSMGKVSIEDCMERYARIKLALAIREFAEKSVNVGVSYRTKDDEYAEGTIVSVMTDTNYVIVEDALNSKKSVHQIKDIQFL